MIEIPLSKTGRKYAGQFVTKISPEDEEFAAYNWGINRTKKGKNYVRRRTGENSHVYLHQVILEKMLERPLRKGEMPDHINGDTLDNRRENLRLSSYSQNRANSRLSSNSKSGLKGAYWNKQLGRWMGQIRHNKKLHYLGLFDTDLEAHKAYCDKAKELQGEFWNDGKGERTNVDSAS